MKWIQIGITFTLLISFSVAAPTLENDEASDDPSRLPQTSFPIHYDITLWTAMDLVTTGGRSFSGLVKIELEIAENTNELVLHGNQINVDSANVKLTRDATNIPVTVEYVSQYSFVKFKTTENLLKGQKLTLEIPYSTNLQLNMAGFYRSSYRHGEETRYLGTTQFQATGARYAFVNYDEPGFKATFKLTIHHNKDYTAIANTYPESEKDDTEIEGGKVTTFKVTPKMSSYLLAFIVSEFEYEQSKIGGASDIVHRVYSQPQHSSRLIYAADRSYLFLNDLETYTYTKYEIEKMDSAAIPDFAAGAMENWGMITYKEQYLILDEKAHHREKFDSMRVIAHELGHQFFGNLVTCKWWDDTWLNEGFATVFEFLLVQRVYPEMRFNEFFNLLRVHGAFMTDALESTHPMTHYGDRNTRIIYDKSGSVIRMFQYVLTESMFRSGLARYLEDNKHEPVTTTELYQAFETIISANPDYKGFSSFTEAYKSWVNTAGFPVIHVTLNDATKQFSIRQSRYFDATETRNDNDPRIWQIPLNFVTESDPNFDFEMDHENAFTHFMTARTFTIPYPTGYDSDQWFIFNKQQIGYYRVNYDEQNWRNLIAVLNSPNYEKIHVMNRAQLIDDAMTLAFDGYLSYDIAFGVLQYLSHETDYMPWRAATVHLDKIDYMLKGTSQNIFRRFIRSALRNFALRYKFEDGDGQTGLIAQYANEYVIDWNCRLGDFECLRKTETVLKFVGNGFKVAPHVEIAIICNGLRSLNTQQEFKHLYERLQKSNDQSERLRIIDGLLCSSDKDALMSFLETTLVSSNEISYKAHETSRILANVILRSEVGLDVMFDFLTKYFNEASNRYSKGTIQSTIIAMSKRITSTSDYAKLSQLLTTLGSNIDEGVIKTINDNIAFNNNWLTSTKAASINLFLTDFNKKFNEIENQLRLPKSTAPSHYKVHLDVKDVQNANGLAFSGEVEITIKANELTNVILMHSRHVIRECSVKRKPSMEEIAIIDLNLHTPTDILAIYLGEMLLAGQEVVVHITFTGTLLTGSSGFYQTSYLTDSGVRKYMAATQFQAHYARQAFPNYDEPEFKAVFELSITHHKSLKAIANMDGVLGAVGADDTVTTTFEPTPVMSSYLNAFVISDLESISNEATKGPNDLLHRVWVRPDAINKAKYALDNSVAALKALEDYTGFKYEMKKVDSAGIPNKGGAMENWGMVTYRENAMIYEVDINDSPHTQKYSGVNVIGHELAHQFFGDAVTCEWWDQTWLNEGFATLFEYHLMGMTHPDWNARHFFNLRAVHTAFRSDSNNQRPMTHPVATLGEISGIFDAIAYRKSGSVLRMFQNAVGDDVFRAGLKYYLETNNLKPVSSQHLIDAMKKTMIDMNKNSFDFEAAFRSWELQRGYPYVEVSFSDGQFHLAQHKFFTNKTLGGADITRWNIPINFATQSNPNFDDTSISQFFTNDNLAITAPTGHTNDHWYVFNKQQLGYYRVNYDAHNWKALAAVLNSENYNQIHVLNRVQFLDDALTFAASEYIDYDILFDLIGYLSHETVYAPFSAVDSFISELYGIFGPLNVHLNKFVHHLTAKLYDTWKLPATNRVPNEEVYDRYNREIAFRLACNAGNEQCLKDAFTLDKLMADDVVNVPQGLETAVMCNGLRGDGKQTELVKLWKKMQAATDSTYRSRLITALSCSDDSEFLKDFLETTLGAASSASYTQTERRSILSGILANSRTGFQTVVNFLEDYELDIMSRFGYNFENLLSVFAREIKHESQSTIFNSYLNTRKPTETIKQNVLTLIDNNMKTQMTERNFIIMNEILRVLGEPPITTPEPTPAPTTPAPTTPGRVTDPPTTPAPATTETPTTTQGSASISSKFILVVICMIGALIKWN